MRSNRRRNWLIKWVALGLAVAAFAAPVAQAQLDEGSSVQSNGYQAFATDFPPSVVGAGPDGQLRRDPVELVRSQNRSTGNDIVASAYGMPRALPADYVLASGDQIEVVRGSRSEPRATRSSSSARSLGRSASRRPSRPGSTGTMRRSAPGSHSGSYSSAWAPPWPPGITVGPRPPSTDEELQSAVSGPQGPLTTASASISTSQRESRRPPASKVVFAGRISPKTSPCARPTPSKSSPRTR